MTLSDLKGHGFHKITIHRNFHQNRLVNECFRKISAKMVLFYQSYELFNHID